MDGLLTPVSTTYLKSKPLLTEVESSNYGPTQPATKTEDVKTADEALDTLRSQPSYDTLISILRFLTGQSSGRAERFSLHTPSPKSAAIVKVLVTEIAPNYWTLLSESSGSDATAEDDDETTRHKEAFIECLRSITGINAILSHMTSLVQEAKAGSKEVLRGDISLHLRIFLDVLGAILGGHQAVQTLWTASIAGLSTEGLRKGQTQILVSLLASGKIISVSAEASTVVGRQKLPEQSRWLTDGHEYTSWLGRNLTFWAKSNTSDGETQVISTIFQRSTSLGYTESLVRLVIDELLLTKGANPQDFVKVALSQPPTSRKVFNLLLDHLSDKYLNSLTLDSPGPNETISAVAGVIDSIVQGDKVKENILIKWCTSSSGAGLGHGVGIRRAVLAVLAKDRENMATILEKSVAQFGDELYIKHAAILQQNVHTEILLLAAGYVSRQSSIKLAMLLRSGPYLRVISNRIAATQTRARFLGMVVGECLSALIDKQDKKLDFHMEETETEEAERLKQLSNASDSIGPVDTILSSETESHTKHQPKNAIKSLPRKRQKPNPKHSSSAETPKAIIQEINSSSDEEEDDDLVPYAKHSDPEDSEDDATLVQRNKLKPPVYIRDLISFFRDSETYDKQKLALQTAPALIRRKANYGTELSSHAEEIAGLLVGIQDKFEIEDFSDLRLQSMISLIVSQPKSMARWFARTFFEGDYSLSQRTSIIVAIGLSARELAGYEVSQYKSSADFASKRLPEKIEQLYISATGTQQEPPASRLKALPPTALDNIATSVTSAFLEPLAAEAADTVTGPDALKLQTFTARYKSKSAKKPRVRAIPNTTASLLATYFFSPLTAHFSAALRSSQTIIMNPTLLGLYLQTLGIIVHAAGPSTISLPQLTSELWSLLLGSRQRVLGDLGAMKGWFVAMAALIEVNEGDMRRLCAEQGREVVETREWASSVFERTRGEDGGEENEVKMLAAGVLIRLGEAIEKYQALLMGDLIGFS